MGGKQEAKGEDMPGRGECTWAIPLDPLVHGKKIMKGKNPGKP